MRSLISGRDRSPHPDTEPRVLYAAVFDQLLKRQLVSIGDLVILTQGELSGVSGGTNAMKIIKVTAG